MDSFGRVVNMSQDEAKTCLSNKSIQGEYQGIPVAAESPKDYVDAADLETKVIGHCEVFNLGKEEDRKNYADLIAKLSWSTNLLKYLEEKTFVENELVVYIAYLEYIKIAE